MEPAQHSRRPIMPSARTTAAVALALAAAVGTPALAADAPAPARDGYLATQAPDDVTPAAAASSAIGMASPQAASTHGALPVVTIVPTEPPAPTMRLARVGERQLGLRLLEGFYATVALQPNRALDPIPPGLTPTERVLVGLSYQIRF